MTYLATIVAVTIGYQIAIWYAAKVAWLLLCKWFNRRGLRQA